MAKKESTAVTASSVTDAEIFLKSKDKQYTSYNNHFPIVGIGASAGGLTAFETFFSAIKDKTNMAFIVIQHLSPDHKSILCELIQRVTKMKVFEVSDGMRVEANCVYVIPPKHDMALLNGTLQLLEPETAHGVHFPIDFFFHSLAQDQREKAVGIILSGTGSDGTQGVRYIKAEGGLVIAQDPASAEYSSMPENAIATGLVDYELLPGEMPAHISAYENHAVISKINADVNVIVKDENALQKIFVLLRSHTGHDFSQYKPSTINRRIERRIALHQLDSLEDYVTYIQQNPDELLLLFHELLIGVTNFFRDPEAFASLKANLPLLLADKVPGETIRVWSLGCSTGEEAYSLAILLQEYMIEHEVEYQVQVFATDIDERSIAFARLGVYPASIVKDISAQRLAKFFTPVSDGESYRIHKPIRDMLIFSEHDIVRDPPFSRLDIVCCRNLLIYMNGELQKKLIPLFHYALNPHGILFLGNSETIGEYGDIFTVVDNKSKLFLRKEHQHRSMPLGRFLPLSPVAHTLSPTPGQTHKNPVKLHSKELTEQTLLRALNPDAILVNSQGDILYIYGNAGDYLELSSGEVGINNVLKMARKGLKRDLAIALHKMSTSETPVFCKELRVEKNGNVTKINVTITTAEEASQSTSQSALYLIIFEELPLQEDALPSTHRDEEAPNTEADARIELLTQELQAQEAFLKTANEKLEISVEELRSSNEELQSVNEELQSTNEELETSKEELQSVNEELSTVNTELQDKVVDLSRSNNDMNNLLAGTGIGTIFVDHGLCILRFTPAVTKIINLIMSDLGRPVGHIVSNLIGYGNLTNDVQEVLNTLVSKELEVQTTEGRWYMMRIQPYRTLDNVIEGAVITFVDITEIVGMREALKEAYDQSVRLAVVVKDSNDAITVQDLKGQIIAWNPSAEKIYGWSESEALKLNVRERIVHDHVTEELQKIRELSQAEILEPYVTQRLTKEGTIVTIRMTSTALVNQEGEIYAIATTERELDPNTT